MYIENQQDIQVWNLIIDLGEKMVVLITASSRKRV